MLKKRFCDFLKFSETPRGSLLVFLLILLLAAIPRVWLLQRVAPHDFYHNDGDEYMELSKQLAAGNGMSLSYYRWHEVAPPGTAGKEILHTDLARTPLFPLLGAALYFLPVDLFFSARVLSLLLALLAVYCTWLIGKELGGKICGHVSALIFALYPYALYYTISWSTENLFLICIALGFLFLLKSCHGKIHLFPWSGFFLALATLTRPNAILLAPLFILILLCRGYYPGALKLTGYSLSGFRKKLSAGTMKYSIVFLLVFLFCLFPWTLRNRIAGGSWNPTTYYGGYVFWLSSSEIMYETYRTLDTAEYASATKEMWDKEHEKYKAKLLQTGKTDFIAMSGQWKEWGMEKIRQEPDKFLYILKERFFHFWRMCPNLVILTPVQIVLLRIFFTVLFSIALTGLYLYRKRFLFWCLTMPVVFGLITSVPFLFVLRYRYPIFAPYVCTAASLSICCMLRKWIKNKVLS